MEKGKRGGRKTPPLCIDVSLQYGMSGWYRLYDVRNNHTQHSIHMSLCQTQAQTNMDGFQTRALNLALELAERTVHQYGEHGRVAASPPVPPARPRSRSPILRRPREARRPDSPETPSRHNVGGKSVGRGPEGQSRGTGKGGHAHHKGNTRSIGTKGTRRGSSNGNNNADNGKGSTTTRQHRGKGPGSRIGVGKGKGRTSAAVGHGHARPVTLFTSQPRRPPPQPPASRPTPPSQPPRSSPEPGSTQTHRRRLRRERLASALMRPARVLLPQQLPPGVFVSPLPADLSHAAVSGLRQAFFNASETIAGLEGDVEAFPLGQGVHLVHRALGNRNIRQAVAAELGDFMNTPIGQLRIQITSRPETPAALADIPGCPYGRVFVASGAEGSTVCSVCLEEAYQPGQMLVRTYCLHVFHYECLSQWIDEDDRCPQCNVRMADYREPWAPEMDR